MKSQATKRIIQQWIKAFGCNHEIDKQVDKMLNTRPKVIYVLLRSVQCVVRKYNINVRFLICRINVKLLSNTFG